MGQTQYGNDESTKQNIDERIDYIYNTYINVIAPFVIQLETLDGEFPVEILNEIRSIFTHFARCHTSSEEKEKEDNVTKAERHTKRAVLDCFKYLCVSYDEHYKAFLDMYKNVDLSDVNDGEFIIELSKKRTCAVNDIQQARKEELNGLDIEVLFPEFEKAYNSYAAVYNLIKENTEKIERIKLKSVKKERWRKVLDISGIAGTLFGIIGVILTIMTITTNT